MCSMYSTVLYSTETRRRGAGLEGTRIIWIFVCCMYCTVQDRDKKARRRGRGNKNYLDIRVLYVLYCTGQRQEGEETG